jgi:hypothetical protein
VVEDEGWRVKEAGTKADEERDRKDVTYSASVFFDHDKTFSKSGIGSIPSNCKTLKKWAETSQRARKRVRVRGRERRGRGEGGKG